MTREERRRRHRRRVVILLTAGLLVLLCLALSQCGGPADPGLVAVATAMR